MYDFMFITKAIVNFIWGRTTWKSNPGLGRAPFYQLVNKFLGLHKVFFRSEIPQTQGNPLKHQTTTR